MTELSPEADRALCSDLEDPIFYPTIEQIRQDLLEARQDIRAGRVHSAQDVLADIDEASQEGVRRRLHGDPVA